MRPSPALSILPCLAGLAQAEPLPPRLGVLLDRAATAPSSHNSQPWRVLVANDTTFRLEVDPARRLRAVDPGDRETLLSLGAFWETLEQAALAQGWQVEAKIISAPKNLVPVAVNFVLHRTGVPADSGERLARLAARSTHRGAFDTTAIRPEHLQILTRAVPGGAWFPAASPQGKWISRSLVEANAQQAKNDARQQELSSWLRFSRQEVRARADGLTPEMMGKGALVQFWWYHFMDSTDVLKPWFRSASETTARNQVEHCAGFLVLTSPDASPASLLLTGREFQRLTLLSPTLGIALHPMSQLMEESPWNEELSARLGISGTVQFVLRAGYASSLPRASLRRPATAFASWETEGTAKPR